MYGWIEFILFVTGEMETMLPSSSLKKIFSSFAITFCFRVVMLLAAKCLIVDVSFKKVDCLRQRGFFSD